MQYPKIIILFNGGSHGDFLKASCEQMLFGKVIKINSVGQALVTSKFKNDAMNMWREGKKTSFKKSNYDHIEVSHVWYSEFEPFPSKFYYINYSKKINSTLIDILIKKPSNIYYYQLSQLNWFSNRSRIFSDCCCSSGSASSSGWLKARRLSASSKACSCCSSAI